MTRRSPETLEGLRLQHRVLSVGILSMGNTREDKRVKNTYRVHTPFLIHVLLPTSFFALDREGILCPSLSQIGRSR